MPSRNSNQYVIQRNQRRTERAIRREIGALLSLQEKRVRLWETGQGEFTDEEYQIIVQANFIGKVIHVNLPECMLLVEFGNGQHGHNFRVWLSPSQVDLIE